MGENAIISMYNGDAPVNTTHRTSPSKATVQRLRCQSVFQLTLAQSIVFAGVLTEDQVYSNVK